MNVKKHVYDFAEGGASMKSLLGGKGANLAEMTSIGIPVPPGFIITTEACVSYSRTGEYPEGLAQEIEDHLQVLEALTGKAFGDPDRALLVSVRSGSVFSMPGMMDTILNLGLNDLTVDGLARSTGNPRFAYDSYRRFINMFGDVVLGVDPQEFEDALTAKKQEVAAAFDTDLTAEDLQDLCGRFKSLLQEHTGATIPAPSSTWPCGPSSAVGTTTAPRSIASSTTSPMTWAPPSACSAWSSATRARPRVPAWPSPGIHPPARTSSTASSS
jgi:pyruvate,orthophosphate dikinase